MERPTLLVFDADCGICSFTARIVRRWDGGRGRVELVPFNEARRRRLASHLADEIFYASWHAVVGRRTVSGAAAFPHLLDALPGGPPVAKLIRRSDVLQRASERIYAWVARNRHRLGFGSSCRVFSPTPRKKV